MDTAEEAAYCRAKAEETRREAGIRDARLYRAFADQFEQRQRRKSRHGYERPAHAASKPGGGSRHGGHMGPPSRRPSGLADRMGLYARYVVPRLTHLAMSQEQLRPYRERVIGGAAGRVLEIGIGSGLNLPLYGDAVEEVIGIDTSPEMLAMAERTVATAKLDSVRLLEGSAERLPLDDRSVDTVVVTWALCTIPDPLAALAEARRVLQPGGSLRFVEHGRSPDTGVAKWQDRLTPLWTRCSGGCHLNRKTDDLLRSTGFRLTALATGYARGPRPMTFMYQGRAEP